MCLFPHSEWIWFILRFFENFDENQTVFGEDDEYARTTYSEVFGSPIMEKLYPVSKEVWDLIPNPIKFSNVKEKVEKNAP